MALIFVRHHVRRPIGETRRYIAQLAASGGITLVSVRLAGRLERAHVVTLDERPESLGAEPAWTTSWRAGIAIPAAAGTLRVGEDPDGATVLEFSGAYASPPRYGAKPEDVFAFRRAAALARSYLDVLGEAIAIQAAA